MDMISMVGKDVKLTLFRKHKYHVYTGRLTSLSKNYVCLSVDGKDKWFSKPVKCRDSIRCLDKEVKNI